MNLVILHHFAIWGLARRFDGAFKWCLAVKAWQLCKPSSKQCLWQRMLASKLIGQGLQLKVLGHSSHLCLLEPGRQLVQLPFLLLARGFRDKGTAFAARGRQMSSS